MSIHAAADTPPATLSVQALIDEHRMSPYQYLVLFICFTVLALDGFDTAAIGYVAPALVAEWGVTRSALAPVLSAALFGLALGALTAGPSADRFGRKPVIMVATLCFGVFSILTAYASSIESMAVLRFLTGIGLGAAMPNAGALIAELAPARNRSFVVNAAYVGFPVGAALGGFVSAGIIPRFGWEGVFLLGGVLPLLFLPVIAMLLPESVAYMAARQYPPAAVASVLQRICHKDLSHVSRFIASDVGSDAAAQKGALPLVLSRRYLLPTLMLWITCFIGLLIFYLLTSWMPLMMRDVGFSIARAATLAALFPLAGAAGTLAGGWLMDRFNPARVLALTFLLAAVLLVAVGQSLESGNVAAFAILVFAAGTMVTGAQASLPALAAPLYPTQARATGIAWMFGVGRFGGILGAMVGGVLLAMQL